MLKMQYLGTGAAEGFPGLFCECSACRRARQVRGKNVKMRSSTLLNDHILIDISPDIFAESLLHGVRLSGIDNIVVTHSHWDHLDDYSVCLRTQPGATVLPDVPEEENFINVYGNRWVKEALEKGLGQKTNTRPERVRIHTIEPGEKIQVGDLIFIPLIANHKKDETCYIYAVSDGKVNLLYANDTGSLPESTFSAIVETGMVFDAVSLDCARGTLPGDGHMGLSEDVETKKRLLEIGAAAEHTQFYLNHFSHMCGLTHDEFQELAEPEGFRVAWDGLAVEVQQMKKDTEQFIGQ